MKQKNSIKENHKQNNQNKQTQQKIAIKQEQHSNKNTNK